MKPNIKSQDLLFSAKLRLKWIRDTYHLPLTSNHFELYEIIHQHFFHKMGEFPKLRSCRDYNDKIQWLKLFDQDQEIIRCSDKLLVRNYVKERVGIQYLVELYQFHDSFSEINFDSLPESFVIKTNNDSGTVILVKNKNELDLKLAASRIDRSLKNVYGWLNGEWAYSYISPKVLVEQYMNPASIAPPADYKFHCVDGKVKFVHYIYDRNIDTKEQIIDPQGNTLPMGLYPYFKLGRDFEKPESWDEMISVAERLAVGFKYVRVDLYFTSGKIYAGEMTFWPMAGCYEGDGQRLLGNYLDFDRTTFKPCLLPLVK